MKKFLLIMFGLFMLVGVTKAESTLVCGEGYIAKEVVVSESVAEVPEISHIEYRHWDLLKGKWTNWSTKNTAPSWYPATMKQTKKVIDQEYAPYIPEVKEWQCVVDENYVAPSKEKKVIVDENCDGTFNVTIYGGDTRRTWRVGDIEKWVEKFTTVEWENSESNVIEWNHRGAFKLADEEYVTRNSAKGCPIEECPEEEPVVEEEVVEPTEEPVVETAPAEEVVVDKKIGRKGERKTEPSRIIGFRPYEHYTLKWSPKRSADMVDITAYDFEGNVLWKLRTNDDGKYRLGGLPGDYFKIRGMNNMGLGEWSKKVYRQ